jgi:2'-5' RNA ligase
MVDRWENRSEPRPGQGLLYWHILLGHDPDVQAIAATGRERLASFSGLHFTPQQWLHVTILVAGLAENFDASGIESMIEIAAGSLAGIRPVVVSLGRVLYHPEAIVLRVLPDGALYPVYAAVRDAARVVGGKDMAGEHHSWFPHITLAYSTSTQDARPIIDALGRRLPDCEVTIDRINLVIQDGPERIWNGRSIEELPFGGRA